MKRRNSSSRRRKGMTRKSQKKRKRRKTENHQSNLSLYLLEHLQPAFMKPHTHTHTSRKNFISSQPLKMPSHNTILIKIKIKRTQVECVPPHIDTQLTYMPIQVIYVRYIKIVVMRHILDLYTLVLYIYITNIIQIHVAHCIAANVA